MVEKEIFENALTNEEMKTVSKIAKNAKERFGEEMQVKIEVERVGESLDMTKGNIGGSVEEDSSEGEMVIEQADEGPGFQLWRNVHEGSTINTYDSSGRVTGTKELKRLVR